MRGGAQAQLLLASDGHYYIVKFQNNPQHRRVLANELLVHVLLRHLQLPAPHGEIVEVGPDLIAASPGLCMELGGRRIPCCPGLQFGSQYPGDPARVPVYDYVPDSLLREVANADCFLGMVPFDKWVSNADGRQAIFFRDRISRWHCPRGSSPQQAGAGGDRRGFVAAMVDHGFAFTAQNWTFRDLPHIGIYPRVWIYERVTGYDTFEPWLSWIRQCSLDVLDDAFKRVPPEWYDGDIAALEELLEQLYERRKKVPELVRAAKQAPRDPFPNWR